LNRKDTLQTTIPVELKIIRVYEILNYSAYCVDEFLKSINTLQSYCNDIHIANYRPDVYGGKEHYIISNLDDLEKLFDRIGIEYVRIMDFSIFENHEKHMDYLQDNSLIIKELSSKFMETSKMITLRDYQRECIDKFTSELGREKYFQGIYYLATGLGKTFIEVCICLEHLRIYPNDNILWITFRNDIIDGQVKIFNKFNNIFMLCNHGKLSNVQLSNTRGKVIVILRQSLNNINFSNFVINGIIYDECHDASKVSIKDNDNIYEGQTYEILEKIRETQKLKYRIGFSATPLTENQRQNQGIIRLYGENNTVNYMYQYSLIKGVENGWLLKPIINYIIIDDTNSLMKLFEVFLNKQYRTSDIVTRSKMLLPYESLLVKLVNEIIGIINSMIIKKGIIWLPCVEMVKYMYDRLLREQIGVTVYFSSAKHDTNDTIFREINGNCIMLACDKFKTGFDAINLEFGINIQLNDSGHVLIQKLGRFTRPKEHCNFAYIFQFCDNQSENTMQIVRALINACNGFGVSLCELQNKVVLIKQTGEEKSKVTDDNIIVFKIAHEKLDIDEIMAKMIIEMNGGMSLRTVRLLIRKWNKIITDMNSIHINDLVESRTIICTKEQTIQYLKKNRIDYDIINDVRNFVKYCLPKHEYEELCEMYYSSSEIFDACKKLKIINPQEYKVKREFDKKLPPIFLISNGLYFDKNTIFNMYKMFDVINNECIF
jgi:superfamily II DNA or RNA helicase